VCRYADCVTGIINRVVCVVFADIEQMVFMDMRKRELLEARFVTNEKVRLLSEKVKSTNFKISQTKR